MIEFTDSIAEAPACKPASETNRKQLFDNGIPFIMTYQEVALLLDKKPKTIRNMVSRREIPFSRVGKKCLFLRESVMEWLKKKESNHVDY